jgi:hypothetical protein
MGMATKTRKVETNAFSVLGDALESAAESFEEATGNARDSARKAAATARRAFGKGVHKTAYGLSYGVIYASIFLTELWPEENPWRRGLVEGAHEAIEERKKIRALKATGSKSAARPKAAPQAKKSRPKASKAVKTRAARFDADATAAATA